MHTVDPSHKKNIQLTINIFHDTLKCIIFHWILFESMENKLNIKPDSIDVNSEPQWPFIENKYIHLDTIK